MMWKIKGASMSVSVVIPCLNEEESIGECVQKIKAAYREEPELEIIVADNGSTDRSAEIAIQEGARVVEERRRGYGAAILRGFQEAKGDYFVMGDADNTYDFRDSVALVEDLKNGAEFAIGNRLKGPPEKGAMPWPHQHIGTPVLTWVLNRFFGTKVGDINCGLRAIRREAISKMKLRSPGMEFASEMVIHAQKAGLKFSERPIRYYRRHAGQAKLRTFRDGWRHLRFILFCAPFPLFVLPALIGMAYGLYLLSSSRFGVQVAGSLTTLVSFQVMLFGVLAKTTLWTSDSFIVDRLFGKWIEMFKLEYGIIKSFLLAVVAMFFFYQRDLSSLIWGSTFAALSVQVFFMSFLISILIFKNSRS